MSWEREYAPVIPAFRKLRLQDHKFKAGLGNTERACLKKKNHKYKNHINEIYIKNNKKE